MHHLPGSRGAGRLPVIRGLAAAALGALAAAAAGCAKPSPDLLATGVYVTNVDATTSVYAALDGGPASRLDNARPLASGFVSERMFPANPGVHTLRIYEGNLNDASFECTFELPTGQVADFVYGRSGTPPQSQLRCPPTFRPAPPND